ncbi:MAG: tRNA lysidine(34) synthetase TilS [Oscillospiraceae bacterium]|nr:tRNA lysidine(34) synthetase TilS [Oscillospiraceae bacterium]
MDNIAEKVRKAVRDFNMFRNGDNVNIAVSGGADSVVLFHVLSELRSEFGIKVEACHINHQLRGEESDRDESFVHWLCKEMNIPLTVKTVNVKSLQKKHQSVEEAAREARYAVFSELCEKGGKVCTAHTASDNAETVLLNLIRGTGLAGLCGIPPVRGSIVRPLIFCERFEIESFCEERDLRYVTDSTNMSDEFTRNKVRMSLIPLIKELNPSFERSVTRMCGILREDCDFLDGLAGSYLSDLRVGTLQSLEKPLLCRIIMGLLSYNNISPSALRVTQILEIVDDGRGKVNLKKNKFAVIEGGILKIETIFQNYR